MSKGLPRPSIKPNWLLRVIFGSILISGFLVLILMGPAVILLTGLAVQLLCFNEIFMIGYGHNRTVESPHLRSICWYFVTIANYFFLGENITSHFPDYIAKRTLLRILMRYHRFISFTLYMLGFVIFIALLTRKTFIRHVKVFAWTHTLLLLIVLQSYAIIDTTFQGLIWLILPVSLVILNDIFAYVVGKFYGKNPLIELSPKKTWEGFIGGGVGTLIAGFILSNVLCGFKYFTCPLDYIETPNGLTLNTDCALSSLFIPSVYQINSKLSINIYPFFWHFLAFTIFASIVAPFGGFCASGFKRAFNKKDFGTVIPGHGGITDRFDCQFLMATFVNVYVYSFVRRPSAVDVIFDKTLMMEDDKQLEFFLRLKAFIDHAT